MAIDEMLEVFGITRSLSRKGNPHDNAAIESMNKTPKTASVYRTSYSTIDELRHEADSYVWWHDNERMHSTFGYMIWYRDRRRKSDLGYVSPMQYRKNLGLAS